jgi:hypothetical protein
MDVVNAQYWSSRKNSVKWAEPHEPTCYWAIDVQIVGLSVIIRTCRTKGEVLEKQRKTAGSVYSTNGFADV